MLYKNLLLMKKMKFSNQSMAFFWKRKQNSKHYSVLIQYPAAKKDTFYKVPDDVTYLNYQSFSGSRIVRNISLGHNIKGINPNAFFDSYGAYITYHGSKEPIYSTVINDQYTLKVKRF